jgi:hypothetical protein
MHGSAFFTRGKPQQYNWIYIGFGVAERRESELDSLVNRSINLNKILRKIDEAICGKVIHLPFQ